jgi:hypothetical protein
LRARLAPPGPAPDAGAGGEPEAHDPRPPVEALARRYGLPPAYQALLLALGPRGLTIVPGPVESLTLFAAPELEAGQVGYRGTRPGEDGFVAPHGWRRAWVVIAADAGDPYFLDVAKADAAGECPVYTAPHGTGTWEPALAASSVEQFLRIIEVWAQVVAAHHPAHEPDEPLDEAQLRRLRTEIARIDPAVVEQWTQR